MTTTRTLDVDTQLIVEDIMRKCKETTRNSVVVQIVARFLRSQRYNGHRFYREVTQPPYRQPMRPIESRYPIDDDPFQPMRFTKKRK